MREEFRRLLRVPATDQSQSYARGCDVKQLNRDASILPCECLLCWWWLSPRFRVLKPSQSLTAKGKSLFCESAATGGGKAWVIIQRTSVNVRERSFWLKVFSKAASLCTAMRRRTEEVCHRPNVCAWDEEVARESFYVWWKRAVWAPPIKKTENFLGEAPRCQNMNCKRTQGWAWARGNEDEFEWHSGGWRVGIRLCLVLRCAVSSAV